jgi:hypothetical protein
MIRLCKGLYSGVLLGLIVTVFLFLSLIFGAPGKSYAFGEEMFYVFPGAWAQDVPTGWITQVDFQYCSFDRLFDKHGHAFDPGFKVDSFVWVGRLIHAQRLSEEWQLTNVIVGTLLADMEIESSSGGSRFHKSVSGSGDVDTFNMIGRWWNNRMVHFASGFSLKFPVGDYDCNRELNIGGNRYQFCFPGFF